MQLAFDDDDDDDKRIIFMHAAEGWVYCLVCTAGAQVGPRCRPDRARPGCRGRGRLRGRDGGHPAGRGLGPGAGSRGGVGGCWSGWCRVLQVSTLYKREFSAGVTVPSHWFPDCSF